MGFDATLKRYFPAVICLLIALAAYFQASGMGQLVATSVALDPSAMPAAPKAPGYSVNAGLATKDEHSTSAAPVIGRNPFDSVTGPLDGRTVEVPQTAPSDQTVSNSDPYADPLCESCRVLLITQSDDPEWSFAAIAGPDGKSILRRVGDDVSGQTVHYIGWDRVWMTSGTTRCQIVVGNKSAPPKGASAGAAVPPPAASGSAPRGKGKPLPPELASKIHKVSESEFNIERSVVDNVLENQAELMKSARIVPEKEGDKIVGIRLFGIRPDSLLGTLGLENGDRLQSINGFEMSDPQKALEAYARLRTAERLTVSINRRGKPMNIDFNIK